MLAKPPLLIALILLTSLNVEASSTGDVDNDPFAFEGFAGSSLELDGVATVTPTGLLELTDGGFQVKGHAFHPAPLRLANASFSTAFVFAIVSRYDLVSDNGLAFVVSPTRDLSSANAGQYLGLLNISDNGHASNHLFAVEVDTILNPEFDDIDSNHIGINVNSLKSVRSHTAGYYNDDTGEFCALALNSRKPMQIWVDYDGQAKQLNVTLAPARVPKPKKPLLSATIDLSAVTRETMYVGLSSATAVMYTRHYVLGWSFARNGAAPALDFSKLPPLPRVGPKARSMAMDIALPMTTAAVAIALLGAIYLFVRRRRQFAEVREDWEDEFGPHRFAYKDLFNATEGFSHKNLLGVGGFGRVYKGVLRAPSMEIAVKKVSHNSKQGLKEFIAEVVSIGRLRHRNLVQLLGYCRREGELLLVYNYMANGSLDKHLYGKSKLALDWPRRYQVIRDVASALLYLHEDWEQVVVHRDIKSSNVLLDSEMNGRLGDFGLARLYDHGANPQSTHLVGTMGYLAPELIHTGKATPLTDVFAFGVFLLELTCGRRPIEQGMNSKQPMLVDLVLEHYHSGSIAGAVDPQLMGVFAADEAELVLKLGLLCSQPFPSARPSMRQVLQYLKHEVPAPELPSTYRSYSMTTLMQSEGFDSYAMSFPSSVNILTPSDTSSASIP